MSHVLAVMCGSVVGFSLGLVGGGGSILAVPLLLYVVGVREPHLAIGTSALAVSANAFANLLPHARAGNVHWRVALTFAPAGALGAIVGSTLGKAVDGRRLLTLFALLMAAVALLMLRPITVRPDQGAARDGGVPRVAIYGVGTGLLAGFFGIGGGFLIVPALVSSTGMPMIHAIGTSLVSVGTLGLTTAVSYAFSGWVEWGLAAEFIAGGVLGGWAGTRLAVRLSRQRRALVWVFAAVILAVAVYVFWRSLTAP
jgi:uncharacterized membrane protein YfcA